MSDNIREKSAGDYAETNEAKVIRHIDDGSDRSVSSRAHVRNQLEDDIEAFLAKGGAIQRVDPHITADPPKKPSSSYGSRPI